jgi:hypothetical protein
LSHGTILHARSLTIELSGASLFTRPGSAASELERLVRRRCERYTVFRLKRKRLNDS